MRITVRFFAILSQRLAVSEVSVVLPPGSTADSAKRVIGEQFPLIADLLPRIAVAVNREYVPGDLPLQDGDELALIPPVSGGTDDQRL